MMCWHKWEYGAYVFKDTGPIVMVEQYKTCAKCGREKKVIGPDMMKAANEWKADHDT